MAIPFIDIFAGPGGLSEGFSRFGAFSNSRTSFESQLAIEMDETAAQTLRLRSFFRSFAEGQAPEAYYRFIRGEAPAAEIEAHRNWAGAAKHVWKAELGAIPEEELHTRIGEALNGARNWVLLGGPPCQAYSLMGRARMTGIGAAAREKGENLEALRDTKRTEFAGDRRHKLYREYLRIVAVHQPAVFVMENVKGILSSRINLDDNGSGELVFGHIRRDLSDPWAAIEGDNEVELLRRCRADATPQRYRLYSLVIGGKRSDGKVKDREFSIRSEDYGVPQRRHRVILLGVRDDIQIRPKAMRKKAANNVSDAIRSLPKIRSAVSRPASKADGWLEAIRRHIRKLALRSSGDRQVASVITLFCRTEPAHDRGGEYVHADLKRTENRLAKWYVDARLKGIVQHFARSHMVTDLVRYLYASASAQTYGKSPSLEDWPVKLIPDHRNVTLDRETGRLKAEGFSDRFKVQLWGQPSSTVTSHIHKDGHYFIHPDPMQCRSLTVREAARLQTFPDNYYFCGNRTEQYKQVGNAVPPYLAYQIAGVVAKLMESAGLAEASDG